MASPKYIAKISCAEGAHLEASISLSILNGGDITVGSPVITDVYPNPNGLPVTSNVLYVNASFFGAPAINSKTTMNGATLAGLPAGFSAVLINVGVNNMTDGKIEPCMLLGFNANQFQNTVEAGKNYEYRLLFAVTKSKVCS